jgi:hypothetical protein
MPPPREQRDEQGLLDFLVNSAEQIEIDIAQLEAERQKRSDDQA